MTPLSLAWDDLSPGEKWRFVAHRSRLLKDIVATVRTESHPESRVRRLVEELIKKDSGKWGVDLLLTRAVVGEHAERRRRLAAAVHEAEWDGYDEPGAAPAGRLRPQSTLEEGR